MYIHIYTYSFIDHRCVSEPRLRQGQLLPQQREGGRDAADAEAREQHLDLIGTHYYYYYYCCCCYYY